MQGVLKNPLVLFTMTLADDISPLLFQSQEDLVLSTKKNELPWVGPVKVSSSFSSTKNHQSEDNKEGSSSSSCSVSDPSVVHGRGLVATRDIDPGECLFLTEPTVEADITEVLRVYKSKPQLGLENIAETILLKKMKRCFKSKKISDRAATASFLALTSEHNNNNNDNNETSDAQSGKIDQDNERSLIKLLLGCTDENNEQSLEVQKIDSGNVKEDEKRFLGIIRHNAFGPDFHNYVSMEETISRTKGENLYSRILGLYPFAAIINHSCSPNAVRVFADEVMVVHSSKPIKKGEEILWSYIPPAQSYRDRQNQIFGKYGFTCQCERCHQEQTYFDTIHDVDTKLSMLENLNRPKLNINCLPLSEWSSHMEGLEEILSKSQSISSATSRSLRLGYVNLYINYFNAALSNAQKMSRAVASIKREAVLDVAGKIHLAFASFHNASTEHISILHLCYEIIASLQADSDDKQKTLAKIRFWTDQLKRSHMIRYGKLGNDVESIREVMKHSRLILRNLDGLEKAQYKFI